MTDSCSDCTYHVVFRVGDKRGQCRRRSPVLDTHRAENKTLWPMTHGDAFCVDFARRMPGQNQRTMEARHDH